ncbi:P-loop containing nucleoside triphosphate hydrolase protein [Chaetomium strumarium]|uniref:P-loop containing nucleoside triphosphate hydrolase protein n=1 Tax=Chaetomium strumarium TaxID=1170767 RepID=A0AAJ0H4I4_9PEZI|nr:P-loop containing nucleoside triphosphate hydrolase protein [Chaetomium strumarium]
MAQSSVSGPAWCGRVDDSFSPHAGDCRGGFDFTLLFEESILTLLPAGLILLLVPPRVWFLWRREKKVAAGYYLSAVVKISAWTLLFSLQLASLILWATPSASPARTRTTLAAVIVAPISTFALAVLSYAEHSRAVRPSTLIGTFLLATLLFDIAHARTLWLRASLYSSFGGSISNAIAYLAVAACVVKGCVVLVLEAVEKRRASLRDRFREYPPEATASIFNRGFFWWLNPLFRRGFFGRELDVDDLFVLDKHLRAEYCFARFQAAWAGIRQKAKSTPTSNSASPSEKQKQTPGPYALLAASYRVLGWPVLQSIPPRACLVALNFCQPFLINHAITLSQEAITDHTTQVGYGLIGAYVFVYVGIALAMGQYQHRTYRSITMLRGGLVSLIYRKTAAVSLRDVDPATSMTLMSADMERIVQGWQTMHEIWANAAEVGIAIYLLERQLGVACVVPVAVSILSLLGSLFAMNFIMSRQAMWLEAIEKRISATSAMLASMKGVKMCGLQDTLLGSLQQLRIDELRISKRFRRLIIWNMVFAYFTQVFAPVLTFTVFSLRARGNDGSTLDTARVFTSLSLFALLSEPLASLVMSLATYLGAVGSFVRIQQFLQSDERADMRNSLVYNSNSNSDPDDLSSSSSNEKLPRFIDNTTNNNKTAAPDAITVRDANFGWDADKPPILRGINLTVPWHKLTMVVGPVGCGKSTLLQAVLGEVPTLNSSGEGGGVQLGSLSIAYCAQNPWHMNGTVRQAIVGCEKYDEKWYTRVVQACALQRDFRELPMGDGSRIGSSGVALSGGQSQRIALARAVYARREIVILDDVLSGLDNSTENHVFHSLLGQHGILRELQSTVLLVSSSAKRLPYADHIVCFGADGAITAQGTFAALNAAGGYVSSFNLRAADWAYVQDKENNNNGDGNNDIGIVHTVYASDSEAPNNIPNGSRSSGSSETACPPGRNSTEAADTGRRTGDVQIYLYYVKSVGWWASVIFVVAIVGFVFCLSFPSVWVQWWAADNESRPNDRLGYWLGIYAMLGGVAIVCLFISCWQMIVTMVPLSGEKFHFALLKTVLSAPLSFFVNTDSGETINRFSQDLQLIDMELPTAALNTFATFVLCIAQMALIGVGSRYAAISFPVVLAALYLIQKVYLHTSRQLRLLDLETKAPLYSLFEESLAGLATVRAFGWQRALEERNHALLDRSQRPFYLLFAVQRWLTLVLDLLVAAVAVLLIVLVVALRGTVAAGGVGLALLNVIQFSQNIKLLVTFWTQLETHIGSVARIKAFTETAVAEDQPEEKQLPPPGWPSTGAIEFDNLSATYNRDDLVLHSVSLTIQPGEKIAVCGRTGSGKTSLIMSLFRLVDLQPGSHIRVDGIDIATLPRQEVRRRIVAVPQHPFLLKGSVRLNADPLGGASDDDILAALQCVQVKDMVDKVAGGLDADIEMLNLSAGQKQLFCLARAMLRPGCILVLDEATSSIDAKTEEVMQRLIRRKFAGHTIIAVAHRIETIMDFDKVAVLDAGRLVEFDSPYALLDKPGSAFARLYNAALVEEEEAEEVVEDMDSLSVGNDISAGKGFKSG